MGKPIIDCHRHLSKEDQKETFAEAAKALLFDMEENGIDKSVVIADNVAGSNTADIEGLLKIFQNNREIMLVGAINPFDQHENKLARIEQLIKENKIIALKLYNGHDKLYFSDKRCFSTYELCSKYDIPLMVHTGINTDDPETAKFNDPKMIVEVAEKFSRLKIIISHFYWPEIERCYEVTHGIDNIYFDTSALADGEVIAKSGGLDKIKHVLVRTISDRKDSILFGTDYPMCKTKSHIDLINSLELSEDLKEKIFSGNFLNLFKKE